MPHEEVASDDFSIIAKHLNSITLITIDDPPATRIFVVSSFTLGHERREGFPKEGIPVERPSRRIQTAVGPSRSRMQVAAFVEHVMRPTGASGDELTPPGARWRIAAQPDLSSLVYGRSPR